MKSRISNFLILFTSNIILLSLSHVNLRGQVVSSNGTDLTKTILNQEFKGGPYKAVTQVFLSEELVLEHHGKKLKETKTRNEADGVYYFFEDRYIRIGQIASFHPYFSQKKAESFDWVNEEVQKYFKGGSNSFFGKPDKNNRLSGNELRLEFKEVIKEVSSWTDEFDWVEADPYNHGEYQIGSYLMVDDEWQGGRESSLIKQEYWQTVRNSVSKLCPQDALNGIRFLSDNLIVVGRIEEREYDSIGQEKKLVLIPEYAVAVGIGSKAEYVYKDSKKCLVYKDSTYRQSLIHLYERDRQSMQLNIEVVKLSSRNGDCPFDLNSLPESSVYLQGGITKHLSAVEKLDSAYCLDSRPVFNIQGFAKIELDPAGMDGGASARRLLQVLDGLRPNVPYAFVRGEYAIKYCNW